MPAMMRIKQGICVSVLCGLAAGGFAACATGDEGGTTGPGKTTQPVCGDGTCETSEVGVCASDCGNSGSNGSNGSNGNNGSNGSNGSNAVPCGNGVCEANLGEDATTCPADCTAGTGSGSSGSIDCNDPNAVLACFPCAIDPTTCDQATNDACAACGL
jgi:hypothetical protein